jgi:hypothetical protein
MRYAIGGERPRLDAYFDVSRLGDRLLAYRLYHGGANAFDPDPLHFIAVFKGDFAEPIIRVDDYPTGVRPIPPDLAPLHGVLQEFEDRALPYWLGIVPTLLEPRMVGFLRTLRFMRPAVHGYDHGYPRYAPLLESRGDPFNARSVGAFDEFAGHTTGAMIQKLKAARRILEDGLEARIDGYIPPCNRGNWRTGRALVASDFRYYLSERRIPFCRLPWFPSDFYGRSPEYPEASSHDVITLHATWEWDVRRAGNVHALGRMLDRVVAQRDAARRFGADVAAAIT